MRLRELMMFARLLDEHAAADENEKPTTARKLVEFYRSAEVAPDLGHAAYDAKTRLDKIAKLTAPIDSSPAEVAALETLLVAAERRFAWELVEEATYVDEAAQ